MLCNFINCHFPPRASSSSISLTLRNILISLPLVVWLVLLVTCPTCGDTGGHLITSSLEVILHLTELAHDADRVGLARCLLNFWVLLHNLVSFFKVLCEAKFSNTSTLMNTLCF